MKLNIFKIIRAVTEYVHFLDNKKVPRLLNFHFKREGYLSTRIDFKNKSGQTFRVCILH